MSSCREVHEYLEKYSVAPSPSRDYYGIKVVWDQIILYTWKISHGPHTSPIVRVSKFSDFSQDKTMHNEIKRVFGDPMLHHVHSIAEGKETTLLTLPKYLVKKLTTYLTFNDVLKLSKLSHMAKEIFDGDIVWEVLYKREKMGLVYRDEKEQGSSHGWKCLFQERQMHKPARNRMTKKLLSDHHVVASKRPSSSLPFKNQKGTISATKLCGTNPQTPKSAGSTSSHNFGATGFKKYSDAEIKGCKLFSKKEFKDDNYLFAKRRTSKTTGFLCEGELVNKSEELDAKNLSIIFKSGTVRGTKKEDNAAAFFENKVKSKTMQKNSSRDSVMGGRINSDKKSESSLKKSSKIDQESNSSSTRSIRSKTVTKIETLSKNNTKKNKYPQNIGKSEIHKTEKALLEENDRGIFFNEDFGLEELIRASITEKHLSTDNFLPSDFWRDRNSASNLNLEKKTTRKFYKSNHFVDKIKNFSECKDKPGETYPKFNSIKMAPNNTATKYKIKNYLKTESCDNLDSKFISVKSSRRFGAKNRESLIK